MNGRGNGIGSLNLMWMVVVLIIEEMEKVFFKMIKDDDTSLQFFSKYYEIYTNNTVEIRALNDVIESCERLGFRSMEVKTNSNMLVH